MRPAACRLLFALLALACAGCLKFTVPPPVVQSYRLSYDPPPVAAEPLDVVLRVTPFGVNAVFDRESIVYREDEHRVGTYVHHRWMANPAAMISDLLARDLAASGAYRAVEKAVLVASDFDLNAEVEAIEEVVGNSSQAHLQLTAMLVRPSGPRETRIALRKTYAASEPVNGAGGNALVAAMSRALARISAELQADVHSAIRAAAGPGEPSGTLSPGRRPR